ncbi:MAG TPA: TIGR03086 family metal-binding protein [Ilumatobacteraceae bacterium]|jgi:uncharacterized protein (TIGR03086 family)
MTEIAERYRTVASGFTAVAALVPEPAWDDPSPCEGWVARDVIRHMVEWIPSFINSATAITVSVEPSVDSDPVAAWQALSDSLQRLLDDPRTAASEFVHEYAGRHTLEAAIAMFILHDVLIHTWDLARATGQDVVLDAEEVQLMLVGIEPMDEILRSSGHFGPRVEISETASDQDRLLAFVGRRP